MTTTVPPTAVQATAPTPGLVRAAVVASRFQAKGALIVIAVGLLVMALGAAGAAGAVVAGKVTIEAQFPYLMSGGLIGLAFVILGSALLVVQTQRDTTARLEAALLAQGGAPTGLPAALRTAGFASSTEDTGRIPTIPDSVGELVVAGTASRHRPTCRLVEGRDDLPLLTAGEAAERGLAPCRVCKPE